jgi:hypothetical protein
VAALELEGAEYTAVRAGETIDVGDPAVSIEVLGPIVEHPIAPTSAQWRDGMRSETTPS